MSFRILNQAPQYLLPSGQVNAGGKLYFYETDLTTPKNTWSDEGMTTLNANPVTMDSAGRSVTDIWGDGEYGVVMTDSQDDEIWTRNNVRADAGAGNAIPALANGQFLSNDGSILQWQPVRQVPDPTGLNNYILGSDGEQAVWIQQPEEPEIPEGGIEIVTGGVRWGNLMLQYGQETMPITGTHTTSKAVVFPTVFSSSPKVFLTTQTPGITPLGATGCPATPGISTTGFTLNLDVNIDSSDTGWNISTAAVVSWVAIGPVAA